MEIPMNLALTHWFQRVPAPAATLGPVAPAGTSSQPLHKNATLVVLDPMGVTVECTQGSLWLTHDGDCKDVILEAGQRYSSTTRARLLVHALDTALVRLACTPHTTAANPLLASASSIAMRLAQSAI
jgi:hypothetical protein